MNVVFLITKVCTKSPPGARTGAGVASTVKMLDKGGIHIPGEKEQMARDFITIIKRACNLKCINCLFLEFSS